MVPFTVAIKGGAAVTYDMEDEQKDRRLLGKVQVLVKGVNSCPALSSRARLATEPTVARVQVIQKQLERHFF